MMACSLATLKKDVQCSLCNDTLTEPKILQCFHTFCKPCIKRHAELIKEVNVFKCPQCQLPTHLPNLDSVEDLKPSLLHSKILKILEFIEEEKICSVCGSNSTAMQHCFDCDRSLCDQCLKHHSLFMNNHNVVSLTDSESTGKVIEILLSREKKCVSHLEKTLDLHCTDCKRSICLECWKQDHDGHSTVVLEKYLSAKRSALIKHVEQLKFQETEIQEQVKVMNEYASNIKENCEKAKMEVKQALEKTIKELQQSTQEILCQIDREIDEAIQNETKGQSILEQARGAIGYAKTVLEKSFTSELIGQGGDVEIYDKSFDNPIIIQDHSLVVFDPNSELTKQVSLGLGSLRKVYQTKHDGDPVPEKQVETEKPAEVGVSAEPKQEQVKKMRFKMFDMKGIDLIHISKVRSFTGIAVNRENTRIALADSSNCCVFVFDMTGNLLTGYKSYRGHLSDPQGLAFLNERDLAIADRVNNRICIVNSTSGTPLHTVGKRGNRILEFIDPCHIHVDTDSNIIISDLGNNRVQVFTKEWKLKFQFGQVDKIYPIGTLSRNGRLFYVSDSHNNVVHMYSLKPCSVKPIRISVIGGKASNGPTLLEPCGLAIDSEDNLLVCDCGNNGIQKFTLTGSFLEYLNCNDISDVAVLNNGLVLVTCNEAGVFVVEDIRSKSTDGRY